MEKNEGRVKWFKTEKGFGFIEVTDGPDIFVHGSQAPEALKEGDWVQFVVKDGKKGPMATQVQKIKKAS